MHRGVVILEHRIVVQAAELLVQLPVDPGVDLDAPICVQVHVLEIVNKRNRNDT